MGCAVRAFVTKSFNYLAVRWLQKRSSCNTLEYTVVIGVKRVKVEFRLVDLLIFDRDDGDSLLLFCVCTSF